MSLYLSARVPARKMTPAARDVPRIIDLLRAFVYFGWNNPRVEEFKLNAMLHNIPSISHTDDPAGADRRKVAEYVGTLRKHFKGTGARKTLDVVQTWAEIPGSDIARQSFPELMYDLSLPYI